MVICMKKKYKKGFTLIEVICAIAILSMALTGIAVAYGSAARLQEKSRVKIQAMNMANSVIEYFKANNGSDAAGICDSTTNEIFFKCMTLDGVNGLKEELNNIRIDPVHFTDPNGSMSGNGVFVIKFNVVNVDTQPGNTIHITNYNIFRLTVNVYDTNGHLLSTRFYDYVIAL